MLAKLHVHYAQEWLNTLVPLEEDKKLLQREAFWIFELKSLFPEGMNEELELSC